jgi:hypothetical protein
LSKRLRELEDRLPSPMLPTRPTDDVVISRRPRFSAPSPAAIFLHEAWSKLIGYAAALAI